MPENEFGIHPLPEVSMSMKQSYTVTNLASTKATIHGWWLPYDPLVPPSRGYRYDLLGAFPNLNRLLAHHGSSMIITCQIRLRRRARRSP